MRRLLLICLLATCAGAPATAHAQLAVGIGDQKADMFSDPRFLSLGLTHARRAVAWDALDVRYQTADIAGWLRAARAAGVSPLISFDHSRRNGRHRVLPTAKQFRHQFARFHARYPWVRDYATWNEANYCGEITCHHPELVAAYYHAMRSVCPHCRILGAELLDVPGMLAWERKFVHAARVSPHYWGLHNYVGANRFSTATTRQLLRATHGEVWFTEIAGLVARRNRRAVHFPQSAAHAALVTRFIFSKLVRLSPRVTRVYLYQWDTRTRLDSWDSALIGLDGSARPAYAVLQQILTALAAAAQPSSGSSAASRVATR
ncbi:MAG: hypothetical protein ACR2ND_07695 [Solirubrobacteraceae bacterium]